MKESPMMRATLQFARVKAALMVVNPSDRGALERENQLNTTTALAF